MRRQSSDSPSAGWSARPGPSFKKDATAPRRFEISVTRITLEASVRRESCRDCGHAGRPHSPVPQFRGTGPVTDINRGSTELRGLDHPTCASPLFTGSSRNPAGLNRRTDGWRRVLFPRLTFAWRYWYFRTPLMLAMPGTCTELSCQLPSIFLHVAVNTSPLTPMSRQVF